MALKQKRNSYNFGLFAEFIACLILRLQFYQILHKRYKTKLGEIDIIAKRGRQILFVEVKGRKAPEYIMEVVSKNQQRRLIQAAKLFLSQNPKLANYDLRFDLIFIARPFHITHIKNAWGE
jgi:putative endonuclease